MKPPFVQKSPVKSENGRLLVKMDVDIDLPKRSLKVNGLKRKESEGFYLYSQSHQKVDGLKNLVVKVPKRMKIDGRKRYGS